MDDEVFVSAPEEPPKVTFDTNMFMSYARNIGNIKRNAIFDFVKMDCKLVLLQYALDELAEKVRVWDAPPKAIENLSRIVNFLEASDFEIYPTSNRRDTFLESIMADKKDLPILVTAYDHQIDLLISGDKHFKAAGIKLLDAGKTVPYIMTEDRFYQRYQNEIREFIDYRKSTQNDDELQLFTAKILER